MDHLARIDLAKRFSQEARARYGDRIKEVILYGSVSRAEDTEESDIDILVVVDDGSPDLQRELSYLSFRLDLGTDELLSVQAVPSSDFDKYGPFSFYSNILRDGIRLG